MRNSCTTYIKKIHLHDNFFFMNYLSKALTPFKTSSLLSSYARKREIFQLVLQLTALTFQGKIRTNYRKIELTPVLTVEHLFIIIHQRKS